MNTILFGEFISQKEDITQKGKKFYWLSVGDGEKYQKITIRADYSVGLLGYERGKKIAVKCTITQKDFTYMVYANEVQEVNN